jgi:hypothetical protein
MAPAQIMISLEANAIVVVSHVGNVIERGASCNPGQMQECGLTLLSINLLDTDRFIAAK